MMINGVSNPFLPIIDQGQKDIVSYLNKGLSNFLNSRSLWFLSDKQEEVVDLLGTIFSSGLIPIWCSSEQDGVCVCD